MFSPLPTAFECRAPGLSPGGSFAITLRPGQRGDDEPFELTMELLDEDVGEQAPASQQQRTQVGVLVEAKAAHLFYRRPASGGGQQQPIAVVLATSRKGGFARCRRHGACFWLSYDAVGSRMLRYGRGYEVEGAVLAEASVPFLLPLRIDPDDGGGCGEEFDDDPLTREPSARLLRVGGAFSPLPPVAASRHVARLSARRAGGQAGAPKATAVAAVAPSCSSSSSSRRTRLHSRPPSVSVASRPLTLTPSPLCLPPRAPCDLLSLGDPRAPVRFDELPATCKTLVAALCAPGMELEWPGTPPGTLIAAISRSLRCGVLKEALEKKAARANAAASAAAAKASNSGSSRPGSASAAVAPPRPRTPLNATPTPALPYLRVAVAPATRSAPGEPFVLELWPAGCKSPIHSHGGACGAFKVLHGTCTLSLYNASGADGDSSSDEDEGDEANEGGEEEVEFEDDGLDASDRGDVVINGEHGGMSTSQRAEQRQQRRQRRKRRQQQSSKNRYERKPLLVARCSKGDVGWFDGGHHQTHSIKADDGPPGAFCGTLQAFRYSDDDDAQLPFMEVEPAAAAAEDARKRRRRKMAEAAAAAAAAASASGDGAPALTLSPRPPPPPPADFSPVSDFQFAEMAKLVLAEFDSTLSENWSDGRESEATQKTGEGMMMETSLMSSEDDEEDAEYDDGAELDTFDWVI